MKKITLSIHEQKFFRQLKLHLGAFGILFPTTTNQVTVFEQRVEKEQNEFFLFPDPDLILSKGYIVPKQRQINYKNEPKTTIDFIKAEACNIKEIPEAVMRKLHDDCGGE
jgi:hypothetical protein